MTQLLLKTPDFPALTGVSAIQPPFVLLDFEYTSFSHENGRIVMIGLGVVMKDRPPVYEDFLVQTPYDPWIWGSHSRTDTFLNALDQHGVDRHLILHWADENGGSILECPHLPEEIKNQCNSSGKRVFECSYDVHKIHPHRTLAEGIGRRDALEMLTTLLRSSLDKGWPLVGHNIYQADLPLLQRELRREGFGDLEIDYELVLDTGLLCKAFQCNLQFQSDRKAFYAKVAGMRRKGVQWSLQKYCVPQFGLHELGVDSSRQHTSAAYDCFVVHKLMEAVRLIA